MHVTRGNPRNYARLVRIFDEDTATYDNALDGCTWLFQNHTLLRRTPPARHDEAELASERASHRRRWKQRGSGTGHDRHVPVDRVAALR